MWMIGIELSILAALGFALGRPMLSKPLSEDDGNWLYLARFWNKGERPWNDTGYFMVGYFNMPMVFCALSKLAGSTSSRFYYAVKLVWYVLTTCSLYWLAYVLWGDHVAAFLAGALFTLAWTHPSTGHFLTYAEHLYGLPINLALVSTVYWAQTGHPAFALAAGLLAAWAFQIKITTLPISCCMAVGYVFLDSPAMGSGLFVIAWAGLNLLPVFLTFRHIEKGGQTYLQVLSWPIIGYLRVIHGTRAGRVVLGRVLPLVMRLMRYDPIANNYITNAYAKNRKKTKKELITPAAKRWRTLFLISGLTLAALPFVLITGDVGGLVMMGLMVLFLFMQQAHNNYHLPHFNMIWIPASALAGRMGAELAEGAAGFLALACILAVMVMAQITAVVGAYRKEFKNAPQTVFGTKGASGIIWSSAKQVGQAVRQSSDPQDKMLVWGDHPSLYIYSGRRCFDLEHKFIYGHHGKVMYPDRLFSSLSQNPPELILFFNYKLNDEWNVSTVSQRIGIEYRPVRQFEVEDEQGRIFFAPLLCRRNDSQYRFALLQRSDSAMRAGDNARAELELRKVLRLNPDDGEALARLALLEIDPDERLNYIDQRLADTDETSGKALALKLRGKLLAAESNVDQAFRALKQSVDLDSSDPESHTALAEIYYLMGRKARAIRSFQQALRLNPYSVEALNGLGVVLVGAGKVHEARQLFDGASKIDPLHPETKRNLAVLGGVGK